MGQKSGGEEVPIRGCWAAQSVPEYKCCPFIQTRQQQQDHAGSGTPVLPCHSQEGSKAQGAAVVRGNPGDSAAHL